MPTIHFAGTVRTAAKICWVEIISHELKHDDMAYSIIQKWRVGWGATLCMGVEFKEYLLAPQCPRSKTNSH